MNQDLLSQLDAPDDPPQETPEQIAQREADEKAARQAEADAKLAKFGTFVDAVLSREAAPAPQAAPQLPPQPTPEQLQQYNDQLFKLQTENPAQYAALLLQQAESNAYNRIVRESAPIIESANESFTANFLSRKKEDDGWYKAVLPEFEAECRDLDSATMLRLTKSDRQRELDRRWYAAKGRVAEKKTVEPDARPVGSAAGGTSMAGSPGRGTRTRIMDVDDATKVRLARNLGVERAKQVIAEMEYGS